MSKLKEVAERCQDSNFSKIYRIIDGKLNTVQYTKDGKPLNAISHTTGEIEEIKSLMFDSVKNNTIAEYGSYVTLDEVRRSVTLDMRKATDQIQKDGFYNPMTLTGTSLDPTMANSVAEPILTGPEENTAMYANGGICQVITDKKSKGVLLNGYTLKSEQFTAQELKDLQDYADSKGFASAVSDAVRDGNIYGGAALFPMFVNEDLLSMGMSASQLWASGKLNKNCLNYFVTADRWNLVVIPNYDLCAQDYMKPNSFYVPISGMEVHTDRAALVRPKAQPYWSAIRNLGWGQPDYVGYLRALLGYELMAMSLPIMCQQMSLIVHELPLDGIIAQNGPEAAKKWQRENEKQLRDWSILNPKAINSYGTISVVNRTYAGFNNLIDAIRKDVSAKAGIPESVIFYSQPNGIFNKTEEDVLLKQSETIRLIQRAVAPSIANVLPYIACSLWGCPDWDTFVKYKSLQISFDTPVVSSPSQKAEIGVKYAQTIKTLCDCGLPVDKALAFATKIIGEVELPSDFGAAIENVPIVAPEQTNGVIGESSNTGGGMDNEA